MNGVFICSVFVFASFIVVRWARRQRRKLSVPPAAGLAAEQSFACRNAKSLKVLFQ